MRAIDVLVEAVGLKHRERTAADHHGSVERHNGGGQKLVLKAELVHHIADDGGKQLKTGRGKEFPIKLLHSVCSRYKGKHSKAAAV